MTDITPSGLSAAAEAAASQISGKAGEDALKASANNLPPADADFSVSPSPAKKSTAPVKSKPGAVVSGNKTDDVLTSRLVFGAYARKSLTIHHLQRRLNDLGFSEALADIDGFGGELTQRSVSAWQEANGFPVGQITAEQARAIFDGDPNVSVVVDTIV